MNDNHATHERLAVQALIIAAVIGFGLCVAAGVHDALVGFVGLLP